MIDVIVILVILLTVGGASYYVYRAKKNGKKCIGCPGSSGCGGQCSCCANKSSNENK